MKKDILVPPSFEAKEFNVNSQYPRPGDTVFCASVRDVPIIGTVDKVRKDGTVCVKICDDVRLLTCDMNVDVVFRFRLKKRP